MHSPLFESLRLDGFLSFAPSSPAVELRGLNVVIGPNGSGKSNLIEAFELLKTLPSSGAFGTFIRRGGGSKPWLWKDSECEKAALEVLLRDGDGARKLRYSLGLADAGQQFTFLEESFDSVPGAAEGTPTCYFRAQGDRVDVATKVVGPEGPSADYKMQTSTRQYVRGDQSIIAQRSDQASYPDVAWLAERFRNIQTFREWHFGRFAATRAAVDTATPTDELMLDQSNLAMMVSELEHGGTLSALYPYLERFLPRFERISSRVSGGTILLYLHEKGIHAPTPAMRVSDGTLRFIALLVLLLRPTPWPFICIEEPELGLHPDALAILAELFIEVSARTQLIVTTHSDALVSALSEHAESVLVCEHRGGTVLSRVEPAKLKHWLEKYRLGDVWRMGELGGNP